MRPGIHSARGRRAAQVGAFPFARIVSFAQDFAGLDEHMQAKRLREVFDEAYKSKWCVRAC